jgi:hypothetical protein
MLFPPKSYLPLVFAFFAAPVSSYAAHQTVVQKISVSENEPLQIQVQTSAPATPQAQIIVNPVRLVIDIPSAVPAASLRNEVINRNDVERVRVGLFSATPPVTRIVLDLSSVQPYQIVPTASGFNVTISGESARSEVPSSSEPISTEPASTEPASNERIIGWVSAGATATSADIPAKTHPFEIKKSSHELAKPVLVQYGNGQLEIHAHDAPLSDVLAMVHQQTGAEIAIPPATREERVVGDFGPGTASEVLAQLLNGTNMNFVVVASPTDPSALRNVILSPKPQGFAEYVPSDTSAPANDPPPQASEVPPPVIEPRPEDYPQPPVQPPDTPAPQIADPPQN